MNTFRTINILDIIDAIGEESVNLILSDFSCPKNGEMRDIGGGVVYLECEDKPQLCSFYQNDNNCFRVFGERYSEKEQIKYIQLLRFF